MRRNMQQRIRLNRPSSQIRLSILQNGVQSTTDTIDDEVQESSTHEQLMKHINKPKRTCRDHLANCLNCECTKRSKATSNEERVIHFDGNGNYEVEPSDEHFPPNLVNNRKYTILSFLPMFLFDQFKQFGNLYFLIISITQLPILGPIFEPIRVGLWWTTVAPLTFVLFVSFMREAWDQYSRYKQDKIVNDEKYTRITNKISNNNHCEQIKSSQIKVGDFIFLTENQRVPCDMILLWCSNANGTTFIRTDQLDGETDWKLRKPINCIQSFYGNECKLEQLISIQGSLKVEPPHQNIYEFMGNYTDHADSQSMEGLNLENTLWSSTVIASGTVVGVCVYTGKETRQALNANEAKYKIGRIDHELNFYCKCIFLGLLILSLTLAFLRGFHASWYIFFARFILLLSAIIPISLRVHMDMAKVYFSWCIDRDKNIPGTIMRCTTIPEELGRIDYLFSDKTGTLTQNEMVFKKLQLQPPLLYEDDNLEMLKRNVRHGFSYYGTRRFTQVSFSATTTPAPSNTNNTNLGKHGYGERAESANIINATSLLGAKSNSDTSVWSDLSDARTTTSIMQKIGTGRKRRVSAISQVVDIMEALALCHNVTPIISKDGSTIDYQASSPDEIALVKFTEKCGVTLIERDDDFIKLRIETDENQYEYFTYDILKVFPFTSESKRMGIILRNRQVLSGENNDKGQIYFYAKGAESVMKSKLEQSEVEWMDEEVENLAREGLRTLVFSKKLLSEEVFEEFCSRYHSASVAMTNNRKELMESIRERLEQDMELIGITGVEDKLQANVQPTLEILRNAHIKVWMLTGDKVETAKVIARSSRLVAYGQEFFPLIVKNPREAIHRLDLLGGNNNGAAIVIDGKSLEIYLKYCRKEFIENAVEASVVICCRCSPTQKAEMVELVQKHTGKVCASIGDGGNDVAMIQKSNIGIGILGKEGQQASLAADISINKFEYITRLFLWHGRLSYKNTAKMAQFIMHRGAIIAFIQCLFSIVFYISAIPLFTGLVAVGYVCVYTVWPVMALCLDMDVTDNIALYYPELYHDLQKGKSLNTKTMLQWLMRSVFQAGVIILLSMMLFNGSFHNIMTISYTALIITELFNIVIEIKHWHWFMIFVEIGSLLVYYATIYIPIPFIENFFDKEFVLTMAFWARSLITGLLAVAPMAIFKIMQKQINPAAHNKLKENNYVNKIYRGGRTKKRAY